MSGGSASRATGRRGLSAATASVLRLRSLVTGAAQLGIVEAALASILEVPPATLAPDALAAPTGACQARVPSSPRAGSQNFSICCASAKKRPFLSQSAKVTTNVGSCTSPAAATAHCTPASRATCSRASPRTTPAAAPGTRAAAGRSRCAPSDAAPAKATRCAWNGRSSNCPAPRKRRCSSGGAWPPSRAGSRLSPPEPPARCAGSSRPPQSARPESHARHP